MNGFNFLAAIQRNLELRLMRRRLSRTQEVDGPWESWLSSQIHASEQDIEQARQQKMTTVTSSGHLVKRIENICIPSVPQWANGNNSKLEER